MAPKNNNNNKSKTKTSASTTRNSKQIAKKPAVRPVGQILKKARLEKGFRLTQIVQQLNISQSYIQAIENGKINELPKEQTYTIGFVKSYAQAVDLDAQEIIDQFKQEFYGHSDQYDLAETETEAAEEAAAVEHESTPNPKMLWGSLGGAAVAILIVYMISKSTLFSGDSKVEEDGVMAEAAIESTVVQEEQKPTPIDYPPQVKQEMDVRKSVKNKSAQGSTKAKVTFVYDDKEQNKVVNSVPSSDAVMMISDSQDAAQSDAVAKAEAEEKGFVSDPNKLPILITVTEDTWIEIKDPENEDLYLSKVITPGFIYQVPKKGLVLSTGNAGATLITVGSQSLPSIGKQGQVLHDMYLGVVELKDKYLNR